MVHPQLLEFDIGVGGKTQIIFSVLAFSSETLRAGFE